MKKSVRTGVTFGLTSGAITTLGLMVGLNSGTHLRSVVMGGIVTIAIADAFSDALGIHISEEAENIHTSREIWEATIATFLSKFLFALTFLVPLIIFELQPAVIVSIIWGILILTVLSYLIARQQGAHPLKVIFEHLFIAAAVIFISCITGGWVARITGYIP